MAITTDQRSNLEAGTKLWAKYKATVYTAIVLQDAEDKLVFHLTDAKGESKPEIHKSISGLGAAVRGGKATNGWDFWTIGVPMTPEREPKPKTSGKAKPERSVPRKANGEVLPIVDQVDGSFECGNCGETFPTSEACKAHLEEAHPAA